MSSDLSASSSNLKEINFNLLSNVQRSWYPKTIQQFIPSDKKINVDETIRLATLLSCLKRSYLTHFQHQQTVHQHAAQNKQVVWLANATYFLGRVFENVGITDPKLSKKLINGAREEFKQLCEENQLKIKTWKPN